MNANPIATTIGGVRFELAGALPTVFPSVQGWPLVATEGDEIDVLWEDATCYLLIDHRAEPGRGAPAHVELWLANAPVEAPLGGLFVVVDAYSPARLAPPPASLAALARDVLARAHPPRCPGSSGSLDSEFR